jgi:ribokinase
MGRVIVVGSLNQDIVVRAPRHPLPGESLIGSDVQVFPGGKGANQAVAARIGATTSMIGRLGDDAAAVSLRAVLVAEHVDDQFVGPCKHDPTGTALIVVAESGENTIVVVPGANEKLRSVHIDDAIASGAVAAGDVVLAQLEVPIDVVTHALRQAKELGAHTILNAAPAMTLSAELLDLLDVLVVNETELLLVTETADMDAALGALREGPTVVVTLGSAGAIISSKVYGQTTIAPFRVDVVDTTGAGDAFCGALAASLADGRSIEVAARFANAAAALSCTRLGAQSGLASRAEIETFLASATSSS